MTDPGVGSGDLFGTSSPVDHGRDGIAKSISKSDGHSENIGDTGMESPSPPHAIESLEQHGVIRRTSEMSHDGSGRAACFNTIWIFRICFEAD